MVTVIVNHKVKDFNAWLPVFEKHADVRKQSGGKGAKVYRSAENPNDVTIIFEWSDRKSMEAFGKSDDLRKTMEKAGVVSGPTITFVEPAGNYSV